MTHAKALRAQRNTKIALGTFREYTKPYLTLVNDVA